MPLGRQLRQFRTAQGLTLRQLGKRAGCSASYLSQIESGQSSPTIESLRSICGALQMDLLDFLQAAEERVGAVPLGKGVGPLVWEREGMSLRHLLPVHIPSSINMLVLRLPPRKQTMMRASKRSQHEVVMVLRGEVELEVDGFFYQLKAQEAIHLDVMRPHRWCNRGDSAAKLLIVNSNFTEVNEIPEKSP